MADNRRCDGVVSAVISSVEDGSGPSPDFFNRFWKKEGMASWVDKAAISLLVSGSSQSRVSEIYPALVEDSAHTCQHY